MKKSWDGIHSKCKMKAGCSLRKEGVDEGTLMNGALRLCETEVSAGPVLLESR